MYIKITVIIKQYNSYIEFSITESVKSSTHYEIADCACGIIYNKPVRFDNGITYYTFILNTSAFNSVVGRLVYEESEAFDNFEVYISSYLDCDRVDLNRTLKSLERLYSISSNGSYTARMFSRCSAN